MIDTIKMYTYHYALKPNNNFVLDTKVNHSTGELINEKLYCNLGHFSIDIKNDRASKDSEKKILCFQASLPKIVCGSSDFNLA